MRKLFLLLVSVILISALFNCEKNKPLASGYQLIYGNNEGVIVDTVLVQDVGTERIYSEKINTSGSTELLLGRYEEYNSGIYLQFENLPDSVLIHSAELILHYKDRIAPGDSSFWKVSHQTCANAFLADITLNDITIPFKDNDLLLKSFIIYSDSLNEIKIGLDSNIVNQWIKEGSSIKHHGIWIESFKADFMPIYHSRESNDIALMPKINLIYTITDSTGETRDTSDVYVSDDGFILLNSEQDLNLDPDLFYIGRGLAFRNLLKFNLDAFDTTTHVNRAILELTSNETYSIRNKSGIGNCAVNRLTEEWIDGNVSDDQNSVTYNPSTSDSLLTFDITASIQGIFNKNYDNFGFLIRSTSEGETISRVAFYTSKSDSLLQPKIYLYYTLPPKQEF